MKCRDTSWRDAGESRPASDSRRDQLDGTMLSLIRTGEEIKETPTAASVVLQRGLSHLTFLLADYFALSKARIIINLTDTLRQIYTSTPPK